MLGRLEPGQEQLFYNFCLDDQIPPNHLVRKLDALLDFDEIRDRLEPFYSEIGRPSVDPELMICFDLACDVIRFAVCTAAPKMSFCS